MLPYTGLQVCHVVPRIGRSILGWKSSWSWVLNESKIWSKSNPTSLFVSGCSGENLFTILCLRPGSVVLTVFAFSLAGLYRKQYHNGVATASPVPGQTDAGYATISYPNGTHVVTPVPPRGAAPVGPGGGAAAAPPPAPPAPPHPHTGWHSLSTTDKVAM